MHKTAYSVNAMQHWTSSQFYYFLGDDIWGEDDDEFDYNYDLTGSPVATTERLAKAVNQHSKNTIKISLYNIPHL